MAAILVVLSSSASVSLWTGNLCRQSARNPFWISALTKSALGSLVNLLLSAYDGYWRMSVDELVCMTCVRLSFLCSA